HTQGVLCTLNIQVVNQHRTHTHFYLRTPLPTQPTHPPIQHTHTLLPTQHTHFYLHTPLPTQPTHTLLPTQHKHFYLHTPLPTQPKHLPIQHTHTHFYLHKAQKLTLHQPHKHVELKCMLLDRRSS